MMTTTTPTTEKKTVPPLIDALAEVRDHRSDQGKRHPLPALLATAVTAMLAGCRTPDAIAHWLRAHRSAMEPLGFTDRRAPCATTFHYVFKRLDVATFEAVVSRWLRALVGDGLAGDAIRFDGKALRGSRRGSLPALKVVSAYVDRLGSAIAQVAVAADTNEHKAAFELLGLIPLAGAVVTADAAYTQRDFCAAIIAGGGDYYIRVKENQPELLDHIQTAFAAGDLSPLRTAPAAC